MNSTVRFAAKSLFAILILAMVCPAAFADSSATYFLTIGSSELDNQTQFYGTISLSLVSGAIEVTVTGNDGWKFFGTNLNPMFGFNVAGGTGGLNVEDITGGTLSDSIAGDQLDGFGLFDVALRDGLTPNAHASFSFRVKRTAGFTDVNDIYQPNAKGVHFAARVTQGEALKNGYTADTVPEPNSLLALGCALASLGLYTGFRRIHAGRLQRSK